MSYLKKIGDTISTKSKELVKSAKAVSETSSLNSIVKSEQQKIDTNYKAMGKLYFDKFSEGPSEDFEEYVEAVKTSMARIEEVKAEIAKVKKRNCCPDCGTRFRSDALFCSKCGRRVNEEAPEKTAAKCSNCGNILEEGAIFCDNCGTKAGAETETEIPCEPALEHGEHENESENNNSGYIPQESAENSDNPGTVKDNDENDKSQESAENTRDESCTCQNTESSRKKCPSCGAEQADDEAVFCIDCGARF